MSIALNTVDEVPDHDIRLIYFDIDGTLLGLDGHYTAAVDDAIARVQALGVHTAVASGRPYFAARHIAEALRLTAPGVFCTGAHVFDPAAQKSLRQAALRAEDLSALLAWCRSAPLHYELYTESAYFVERDSHTALASTHAAHMKVAPVRADFDTLLAQPVVKMLIAVDSAEDHHHIHAMAAAFPHLHFACAGIAAHPQWLFASIVAPSACKRAAFDFLLQYHGLGASQVMSFGDAQSDEVFLSRAGFGIAMGNAVPSVKQVARFVTAPVWDDGIAYALRRFFPQAFDQGAAGEI